MEPRFAVRKKQLVRDAQIRPKVYRELLDRLPEFLEPFARCLVRSEPRAHLRAYLEGLMSDLERKNVESIAYLHDEDRRPLQHFIGESHWDPEPMLAEQTRQVGVELGEPDGVIVLDPSGCEKDGPESVGVERQWLGRFGKVDNGQVGVYLGYVSRRGHALCDVRLYLPKSWAGDRKRRKKCGVPKAVRFRTKPQLAQEMLAKRGSLLPHEWVAGDDEMGRNLEFRASLREQGERYLLAVPSNTKLRDGEAPPPEWNGHGAKPKSPWINVRSWCAARPPSDWVRIDVRDGEKGPLVVEAVKCRVQAHDEKGHVGPEELLFVTRVRESKGWKLDYYLSNAPAETDLAELARVAKAEHRIEDALKRAKSEAGMADYEVRTWLGWHHHQALSLLATWFLTRETQRGEKMGAGDHGSADSFLDGHAVARTLEQGASWLGTPSHQAPSDTKRTGICGSSHCSQLVARPEKRAAEVTQE